MLNNLLGEFGLLDVLVVLNYFESRKANKNLKKLQKIQIMAQFRADNDLDEIVEVLKEIKNG